MVKGVFLTIFALSTSVLSSMAYAETPASRCLSVADQKELGAILTSYDAAVAANPDCIKSWGAAGCLGPRQLKMKQVLESDLKACSQEK